MKAAGVVGAMSSGPVEVRPLKGGIHPTAVVHDGAAVGAGAHIGPYCVIEPGAVIGEGCVLHGHVVVHGGTTLGRGCEVFSFAVLGAAPQDLKYRGEESALIIGERCRIREHATLHRGTAVGGGRTVVGSDCLIMVGAHVAHDCVIEDGVILANGVMLGGHCLVEHGATLAGGAAAHHFATIGRLSFVGGMARITKDVPPFLVVEGNPAEARKVNTTAMSRRGWDPREIEAVRGAFKALYRRREGAMADAMRRLRAEEGQFESVLRLCESIERAQCGVHGRWLETLRERHAAGRNGNAGG